MSSENTTKFSFSWNGIAARGFADGDAVSAEFDNDEAAGYSGTKGEGLLVVGKDGRGKVTVKLLGTSSTIKAYQSLDKSIKSGETIEPPPFIFKKIVGGNSFVYTGTCILSKNHSITASRDATEIELIFVTADMVLE